MAAQYPLTCQQQWLWNLLSNHPDWKSVIANGFRIAGKLNIEALEKSLAEVIRRHASLRTRIVELEGVATQQVDTPQPYSLDLVDVPGASAADVQSNAQRLLTQFSESKVDVGRGPLFRAKLLRLGESEHWLLLAVHRLIGECFTAEQISPDLWSAYPSFLQGSSPSQNADPPQYHDYALWQDNAAADWTRRHEEYWNKRLATASNIQWPTEEGVCGIPRGTLGRMNIHLGESLSQGLRDLARREKTLLATLMLTIYIATLWRSCGQPDFVVPFFVAGRQSEHKSIIGYFSHILYLRIQLTGAETLRVLLKSVGNEFFRALSHQDFGRMAMRQPQLLAGNFFQWITWHPEAVQRIALPVADDAQQLTVERVSVADFAEDLTAMPPGVVDVELTCFDTSRGIYASGVYRADLFTPSTMARFMRELRGIAAEFLQDLNAPGQRAAV